MFLASAEAWIPAAALFALIALAAGAVLFARRIATRRRRDLMARPLPEAWERILREGCPLYRFLPAEKRRLLRGYVQVFLAEKSFEGCNGLRIDDEIRVTIAGQACLLLLNGKGNFYPNLRSILVYPAPYLNRPATLFSAELHEADEDIFAGESWSTGSVVLSWHDVAQGAEDRRDGYNVVIHEFAHQLDQLNGAADGVPLLRNRRDYRRWARILGEAFDGFQGRLHRGQRTVLDEYGATSPEEFFAVATETFFEKPALLKRDYPDLYGEFAAFYDLDPASWRKETVR